MSEQDESNEVKTNIVKNGSKAYGYNYSSLADMAKAGVNIPKMRIKPIEGVEYIEYLDDDKQWQLGARIVVPEMKGMNAAQAYGSALTYARRYTVQMAKSVACDDDAKLETQAPVRSRGQPVRRTSEVGTLDVSKFQAEIKKLPTDDDIRRYYAVIKNTYGLNESQQKVFGEICKKEIERRQRELEEEAAKAVNGES